jgi:hypothetical protein
MKIQMDIQMYLDIQAGYVLINPSEVENIMFPDYHMDKNLF